MIRKKFDRRQHNARLNLIHKAVAAHIAAGSKIRLITGEVVTIESVSADSLGHRWGHFIVGDKTYMVSVETLTPSKPSACEILFGK